MRWSEFRKLCIFILGLVGFLGCVSKPPSLLPPQTPGAGEWSAKAQITDQKTGKSQQVNLSIMGIWPDQLRLEARAILGISVGTLTLQKDDFAVLLPRQHKFFQGHASEKILQSVFQLPVDPHWLLDLAFDQPLPNPEFNCVFEQGRLKRCQRPSDGLTIEWRDRDSGRRRVVISAAQHELQIVFLDFSEWDPTKVQEILSNPHSPFRLTAPDGFTNYNVR